MYIRTTYIVVYAHTYIYRQAVETVPNNPLGTTGTDRAVPMTFEKLLVYEALEKYILVCQVIIMI